MVRKFAEIAFTPAVKALQEHYGSRKMYEKFTETGVANDTITPEIAEFIQQRDSFYLGTVNSNNWPYIQFRGGFPGFLKILDEKTLGFADFAGNSQYISIGNLSENDRIFLFLMDYANRRRLKIWGRAKVVYDDLELMQKLSDPEYYGKVERAFIITVEAWDRNCPQHIPVRYSETEVAEMIAPLQARIKELEAQIMDNG